MNAMEATRPPADDNHPASGDARPGLPEEGIGKRLRTERERHGLSLRKLAAKLDISPSALSQIETGRSRPSVSTLYAIVNELGISLDDLFAADPGGAGSRGRGQRAQPATPGRGGQHDADIVQRAGGRKAIDLESGARWERLNPTGDREVDFLEVTYDVGGASSTGNMFMRHSGREYGLVLSGRLKVTVGFDEHELNPGDSISFDSSDPHRLEALGDEPAKAIWFVIGRHGSDTRAQWDSAEDRPSA